MTSAIVDLHFRAKGRLVPLDHGYPLYGALCVALPALHSMTGVGVHPIRGKPLPGGLLALAARSAITLRMPLVAADGALRLIGKDLDIAGQRVVVGAPTIEPLRPSAILEARLVAIKSTVVPKTAAGTIDKDALATPFGEELRRQLARLEVRADVQLLKRRVIVIQGRRVIGWGVRLTGLSDAHSVLVQERGLGGKRKLGCGVFVPARGGA